jgi:hypothetical protein
VFVLCTCVNIDGDAKKSRYVPLKYESSLPVALEQIEKVAFHVENRASKLIM